MKQATLCYLFKDHRVCLGLKKRGFGINRWNGFGGKVKEGESVEEALRREVSEEAGVTLNSFEKVAELDFHFANAPGWNQTVHVYFSLDFTGQPLEGEEMRPKWFSLNEIPYAHSWPDDKIWYPLVLSGKKVKGEFYFGDNEAILKYQLKEVANL